MLKRIFILTLCISMLLSLCLVSCRTQPDQPADTEETGRDTETSDTTEATASTTEKKETTMETTTTQEIVTEAETEEIRVISRQLTGVRVITGDTPAEIYAGEELLSYLEKRGVPTDEENGYPVTLRIDSTMADDSYRIVVQRKNSDGATITGGNGRGVLYGVYRFLEDQAGIRFFTPTLETIPTGKMSITTGITEYTPVFENRHTDWYSVKTMADWMVKNGLNCSIYTDISEEMGSKWSYGSQFVHNICAVTNTDPNAQPCLTDPANLEYAIQYVRNRLASEPGVNIITVSQMDNQNYCRCANCAAVDAEEGSPAGTLLRFVQWH